MKRTLSSSSKAMATASDQAPAVALSLRPILDLPQALANLHLEASSNSDTPWTHAQIREIAGPLLSIDGCSWAGASALARLKLLALRSAPPGRQPADIELFFENADKFNGMTRCATLKTRTVTADELVPLIDALSQRYVKRKAEELAHVLSDVVGIDIAHSSAEATGKWRSFTPTWDKYCTKHPYLVGIVRPAFLLHSWCS